MNKNYSTNYGSGKIRIISGRWRGRKITFPQHIGIRPTSDQTRETLFNWLNPHINQAICLDLFAGSGALGLEALSRGADEVISIDQNKEVIQHLIETTKILNTNNLYPVHLAIPTGCLDKKYHFDIVFIDPPFHKQLVAESVNWLISNDMIQIGTLIYVEQEKSLSYVYPKNWRELHTKYTKETKYQLLEVI